MPVCQFTKIDGSKVRFMTHPDSNTKKSGKNHCDEDAKQKPKRRAQKSASASNPTRRSTRVSRAPVRM